MFSFVVYHTVLTCLVSSEEDKKALCQILGKLHIPETVDDDKLRTLKLLMHNIRSVSLARTSSSELLSVSSCSVDPFAIRLRTTHLPNLN